MTVEASTFGKWIELLKEAMPRLARVSVIFHSETLRFSRYYEATLANYLEPTAVRLGVDVIKNSCLAATSTFYLRSMHLRCSRTVVSSSCRPLLAARSVAPSFNRLLSTGCRQSMASGS